MRSRPFPECIQCLRARLRKLIVLNFGIISVLWESCEDNPAFPYVPCPDSPDESIFRNIGVLITAQKPERARDQQPDYSLCSEPGSVHANTRLAFQDPTQ